MTHALPLTGERTLPGVAEETYWFRRHEAGYAWAAARAGSALVGATVLEAGAGEGYGADGLLAQGAATVLALDYDATTTRYAATAYPRLAVARANLAALPVREATVDVVVTLQVVEHLWDLRGFLRDCARVLRPGGLLLASTPNRPVHSPGLGRGERPVHPYHVQEFDAAEVADLVGTAGFTDVRVEGLHHGPRLSAWEEAHGPLVGAQVEAVLGGTWPDDLARAVESVTVADFVVDDRVDDAHDLLVSAVRP
ncbi:MAG: methyltransferase domain-containing protein [Candidatus Nanopelagicales bacterium]